MESWNEFILYIFFAEVAIILIFLVVIPLHRIYLHYKQINDKKTQKKITKIIIECFQHKKNHHLDLKKFAGTPVLLKTIETFEHRFNSPDWEDTKNQISELYLLPYARKKANSSSWIKRNYAARCFALTSLQEDKDTIVYLMDDPVFLVRSAAAMAAVNLGNKPLILEIIRKMSKETGYSYYFYRDLLLKRSDKTFAMIKEFAETEKNPAIHLTCLDLMTSNAVIKIPDYLKEDLLSQDPKIRLAAVKILARNPQGNSVEMLSHCLDDEDPDIRSEAVLGLHYFATDAVFEKLQNALNDPVWLVRLHAAETLKKMGEKGSSILKNQNPNVNKNGYEAAQAVLQ